MFDHDISRGPALRRWREEILYFEGSTVTRPWIFLSDLHDTLQYACSYSTVEQLWDRPASGGHRLHAHVDDEGWLYVLEPCRGWEVEGRFVGDRFETLTTVLRRLPVGAHDELDAEPRGPQDILFGCHDLYESRTAPIPPLPSSPRRWWRRARAEELGRLRVFAADCRTYSRRLGHPPAGCSSLTRAGDARSPAAR